MKLSVIIPVYNVEKYLGKCLDSLISQDFQDVEFICVNDGSTDNSLEVLKNYQQIDSRIVVVNSQNHGVSVARNKGLDVAKGEFIMFVDSDDYLVEGALKIAYDKITQTNSDICIFGHYDSENNQLLATSKNNKIVEFINNPDYTNFNSFLIFVWDKIYRKEFLTKNNLKFEVGIKNAEDVIFNWMSFFAKPKYDFIETPLYIYLIRRENSATSKYNNCIKNDLEAFKRIVLTSEFKQQSQEIKLNLVGIFCGGAIMYWNKFYKIRRVLYKEIEEMLKYVEENFDKSDLKTVKKYNKLKNIKFSTLIKNIFSIENTKSHKIITILGMRIKLKRKSQIVEFCS